MSEETSKSTIEQKEEVVATVIQPVIDTTDMRMKTSDSIKNIALALSKAQGQMTSVGKDSQSYGYKYADLASVIDVAKKPMTDNELAVTQGHYLKKGINPSVVTESLMMHSSGEWIKTSLEIPITVMKGLNSAQLIGVNCTYSKRYLLQAQIGLASEDSDGVAK